MNKLTRMEASAIFKARTRMLDVKNNYRDKYNDTKCRKCDAETETQEHILEECPGIHKDNSTKVKEMTYFKTNKLH
jgi:Zn finger protein HypA/HybF involved in hydrogenase expression